MSFSPIVLTRFAGSTLEPSTEPIFLYESQYYQSKRSPHMLIVPTRCTPPLNRENKPEPITIPDFIFDNKYIDDDEFSAWSYDDDTATADSL
ncbi:hypothetical protein BY458DRAFT_507324 [Sporodiniella umbellata]|nr:hypothetical protein BY458DRAFT_507324 [Sporodiniella umbellata]